MRQTTDGTNQQPERLGLLTIVMVWSALIMTLATAGCRGEEPYGLEQTLASPLARRQVWAVAPAVNLSGENAVDPILQADVLYGELQTVQGITALPVNRVAQVMAGYGIGSIQTHEQASLIADALGADALLVPTITLYDPYNPPKMAATLTLFPARMLPADSSLDMRALVRAATPDDEPRPLPRRPRVAQVTGMFDASSGSVRARLSRYSYGRSDPSDPLGGRAFLLDSDRYAQFVWGQLLGDLLGNLAAGVPQAPPLPDATSSDGDAADAARR